MHNYRTSTPRSLAKKSSKLLIPFWFINPLDQMALYPNTKFKLILVDHLKTLFKAAVTSSSSREEMLNSLIITLPKERSYLSAKFPSNFTGWLGFTKWRQISDATHRTNNIIYYAKCEGVPSLLLCLDAEKAFDWVHWTYLCWLFRTFASKGIFCQWSWLYTLDLQPRFILLSHIV